MVRRVTIECTQCRQVSDLHLTTDAHVVIFSCPSCGASLLSYHNHIAVLTESELDGVKAGCGHTVIEKILQTLTRPSAQPASAAAAAPLPERILSPEPYHIAAVPESAPFMARVPRRHRISGDDVIDLHFALSGSADSKQFIDSL